MKERKYDLQERFSESTTEDFSHKHKIAYKITEKQKLTIKTEFWNDTTLSIGNSLLDIGCSKNAVINVKGIIL